MILLAIRSKPILSVSIGVLQTGQFDLALQILMMHDRQNVWLNNNKTYEQ